jgi:hypothetical protein
VAIDLDKFLHSLCRWLSAQTSLRYGVSTPTRQLFRHQAVEDATAADPYSVVRIYGGPGMSWLAQAARSIQIMTIGTAAAATLAQAQKLYEAFLSSNVVAQGTSIGGYTLANLTSAADDGTWKLIGVDLLQQPGINGVDERGRVQSSFNVEVTFVKVT